MVDKADEIDQNNICNCSACWTHEDFVARLTAHLSNDFPLPCVRVPHSHDVTIRSNIPKAGASIHVCGQLLAMESCSSLQASKRFRWWLMQEVQYSAFRDERSIRLNPRRLRQGSKGMMQLYIVLLRKSSLVSSYI